MTFTSFPKLTVTSFKFVLIVGSDNADTLMFPFMSGAFPFRVMLAVKSAFESENVGIDTDCGPTVEMFTESNFKAEMSDIPPETVSNLLPPTLESVLSDKDFNDVAYAAVFSRFSLFSLRLIFEVRRKLFPVLEALSTT